MSRLQRETPPRDGCPAGMSVVPGWEAKNPLCRTSQLSRGASSGPNAPRPQTIYRVVAPTNGGGARTKVEAIRVNGSIVISGVGEGNPNEADRVMGAAPGHGRWSQFSFRRYTNAGLGESGYGRLSPRSGESLSTLGELDGIETTYQIWPTQQQALSQRNSTGQLFYQGGAIGIITPHGPITIVDTSTIYSNAAPALQRGYGFLYTLGNQVAVSGPAGPTVITAALAPAKATPVATPVAALPPAPPKPAGVVLPPPPAPGPTGAPAKLPTGGQATNPTAPTIPVGTVVTTPVGVGITTSGGGLAPVPTASGGTFTPVSTATPALPPVAAPAPASAPPVAPPGFTQAAPVTTMPVAPASGGPTSVAPSDAVLQSLGLPGSIPAPAAASPGAGGFFGGVVTLPFVGDVSTGTVAFGALALGLGLRWALGRGRRG